MESLGYKEMQKILMNELRLLHYPIAVKFIFDNSELEDFKSNADYYVPAHPLTFCQFEIGPRMKGQTVLGTRETLGCTNGAYVFGWKPYDEAEVRSHLKYAKDWDQAVRFVQSKPRLPEGELKAFVVSPLADSYFEPDTVHFYCDNMQAYHLLADYMAALDVHPLRSSSTINSSACGGNVYSLLEKTANTLPACSGSYNSGKTERGETNVIIPGAHIRVTVQRLLD
ncbi:MAG: DUF169 domain-containing protein, partial [Nitrospirales bacterium]|nr:DUF169 domain-containing protein [Nitrospirales bacterium]